MGYSHAMMVQTQGIQRTAPVRWRAYDAMCGVYWQAEGQRDATGYYRSPDPRIMLFFEDVSQHIGASSTGAVQDPHRTPLARAVYVPAGTPIWTRFSDHLRFSHLDVHIKEAWLAERFARTPRGDLSGDLLLHSRYVHDVTEILAIGEALKQEICSGAHHPLVAESLAVALVAALVAPKPAEPVSRGQGGGLTPAQMRRLLKRVEAEPTRLFLNAELAGEVGLSPSWFSHALKRTTGMTPHQWQQVRRIDQAKHRLMSGRQSIAEVAGEYGFSDQGHFTRVFRQVTGTTPAVWLRETLGQTEGSSSGRVLSQQDQT